MSTQVSAGQPVSEVAPAAVQAWTRLLRAHASTTRLLSAQLHAEHSLSINDYEALLVLSQAEDRRLKRVELARRLLLTPSGITRLLEGLEAQGLVERTACREDLRVAYAQLTPEGAKRLEAASCSHVRSVRSLLEEHLEAEEIGALAELLGKLPNVLGADESCRPS